MLRAKIYFAPGRLWVNTIRDTVATAVQQACVEIFSTPQRELAEADINVIARLLLDSDRTNSDIRIELLLDYHASRQLAGDVNGVNSGMLGQRIASRLYILDPEGLKGVAIHVALIPIVGEYGVTVQAANDEHYELQSSRDN